MFHNIEHYSEFRVACNFIAAPRPVKDESAADWKETGTMSDDGSRRVRVAAESDLSDESGLAVTVGDKTIAIFRVDGRCYAIDNVCPHRGGPLAEGDVEGHIVHCPWHGWTWDVRTGLNPRQPASKVACFPVTVEDGSVFIDVDPDPATG